MADRWLPAGIGYKYIYWPELVDNLLAFEQIIHMLANIGLYALVDRVVA